MLVKSASLEKDIRFDEIKKEIIIQYSNALSKINLLKLKSENLVITNAQYAIAEKNFTNGIIEFSDLAKVKQEQTNSLEQYESTKAELINSLLILEIITKTPILNREI